MSYKYLKLKLRVFLAGHIVTMLTYYATKLTATCSPMIGQIFLTMIVASTDIERLYKYNGPSSLGLLNHVYILNMHGFTWCNKIEYIVTT